MSTQIVIFVEVEQWSLLWLKFAIISLGKDATQAFEAVRHTSEAKEMMNGFLVGSYVDVSILVYKSRGPELLANA